VTTYAYPSITPNSSSWELVSNTATYQSPITGAIQTVNRGGTRWAISLNHRNLSGDDRAEMMAWLAKLNGQQHRFTVHDHSHTQRGSFGGTPLVAGGSQTGNSLDIDGASNSVTNWIRAGDYFTVNGELKMATADANSDGSGNVTLACVPELREAPADNAAIDVTDPVGTFILTEARNGWTNVPGVFSDFTITAIEDIA